MDSEGKRSVFLGAKQIIFHNYSVILQVLLGDTCHHNLCATASPPGI